MEGRDEGSQGGQDTPELSPTSQLLLLQRKRQRQTEEEGADKVRVLHKTKRRILKQVVSIASLLLITSPFCVINNSCS